jgi:DNA-binding transcriptional LysR family regulator
MELRTLHYFTVVAQELNITRAAEKLNMSQPPLSNQIKALEEELGVQLFIRGKRRLELTEEGGLLLRRAVQIQELADKTRQEIASLREGMTGVIYLSMVEGRAPFLAARWIAGFREEFPLVRYNLWNGSSDDVLDRLHKGLADLAVIAAPYDTEHLEGFPVGREPWIAMLHPDHPLAQPIGDTIPLSSLVGEPLIVPSRKSRVDAIRRWFGEVGAEPHILCEMSNYMDAAALTSQGVGISIFPQTVDVSNGLVVSKVVIQPSRQVEYILVWNRGQPPSGLTREFIHFVQENLRNDGSR